MSFALFSSWGPVQIFVCLLVWSLWNTLNVKKKNQNQNQNQNLYFKKKYAGGTHIGKWYGMCRGHGPLFSGQLALLNLPIYRKGAAHVPLIFNFEIFFFHF